MNRTTRLAWGSLALAALALPARAQVFTLDFDGDKPPSQGFGIAVAPGVPGQDFGSAILGFYNGDPEFKRLGNEAWNTTFGPGALAIGSLQAGGQGNFPTAHSGWYAAGTEGSSFHFDVRPGLMISKLSFWYNAAGRGSAPGFALFSDGDLVTGPKDLDECVSPTQGYCGWKEVSVAASELAGQRVTRVVFLGTPGQVVFDDIAVTAVPVPEPASYALMALGLVAVTAFSRRKR
jgi:hypothetical protein